MVLSLPGLTPPCPRWAGAALPSRPPVCIKGQCLRPSTTLGLEMGPVYSFVFSDVLEILPPPCCSNCSSSPHFQLQCRLLQFSGCAPWALSTEQTTSSWLSLSPLGAALLIAIRSCQPPPLRPSACAGLLGLLLAWTLTIRPWLSVRVLFIPVIIFGDVRICVE